MKYILIFLLINAGSITDLSAQSKQIKVLLQQVSALKSYISTAKKGYDIAKKGLNTIGDFKRGEFNLHTDYFTSLDLVNPRIRDYTKVAEITILQQKIITIYQRNFRVTQSSAAFNPDETAYIQRVFERIVDDGTHILDQLIVVTTDNQLKMKDDQRLQRINALYEDMLDNHTFCERFSNQVKMLALSRTKEGNDIKTSQLIIGINNQE